MDDENDDVVIFGAAMLMGAGGTPVAAKLGILTQPDNTNTAGSAYSQQPVIEIQDSGGSRVTSSTAAVTVAIASGPGTIGGTLTVNAVAGVATFTDITTSVGGVNTLVFTSSGLTSVTSASFANGPLTRHQTSSGDIQTGASWDQSGLLPHFLVDTMLIDSGVASTMASNLTIGADGLTSTMQFTVSAGGSLTVNGGRLTVKCSCVIDGLFTINQPASMRASSATAKCWRFGPTTNGLTTTGILTFTGTSGSHVAVDTDGTGTLAFGGVTANRNMGFDATYTDFTNLGQASVQTGYFIWHSTGGSAQKHRLNHCTFTGCGGISTFIYNVASDIDVQNNYEWNPQLLSSSAGYQFQSASAATTGVRVFKNNSFGRTTITWFDTSMKNWVIDNNAVNSWRCTALRDSQSWTTFTNWFLYQTSANSIIGGPSHTATGGVTLLDGIAISSSYLDYAANGDTGTSILDMICYQTTDAFSAADGALPVDTLTSGAMVSRYTRHLQLKNAAGLSSCAISTGHDTKFRTRDLRHNTISLTQESSGTGNLFTGAVTMSKTKTIARNEDSIYYAYGAGITSRGIQYYSNDVASGAVGTNGLRFTSDGSGNTSTVIKCAGKTWDTSTTGGMVAAGASLIVTATNSVVGAPTVGDVHVITANTATTITVTGGFNGTVWDGVDYMVLVVDQNDPTTTRNNYHFGCATGQNYDSTGQPTTPILGHIGFAYSTSTNTNSVNGGAGTDPIANGPQFLLSEPTWDIITADIDFMGFSAGTAWVTAHAYAIGDVVSHSSSDFFGSRTINFTCIQAHTSTTTNDVNEPGKRPASSNYRAFWMPSVADRVGAATVAGTTYTNNSILLYGDTASTPAANVTPIQMLLSRIRWAKRPTNATLLAMAANSQDGICPGAVDGNAV